MNHGIIVVFQETVPQIIAMADENSQEQQFLSPSRRSYVYESSKGSRGNKRVIFIVIGIIILIALVAIAVIATGGKGENEKNLTPTPAQPAATFTPAPTETPTPTDGKTTPTPSPKASPTPAKGSPTPKISVIPTGTSGLDRANLKVAVLNGSGEAGAATKASDALKKLGYDVVSSGNADNFDYETTTIQVKSTKKSYLDMLKTDLSDSYTVGTATADYTGDSDAVVIVGKK